MGTLLNAAQISSFPPGKLYIEKIATSKPIPPDLKKKLELLQMAIEITRVDWSQAKQVAEFDIRYGKTILHLTATEMQEDSDIDQTIFMGLQESIKKFRSEKTKEDFFEDKLLNENEVNQVSKDLALLRKYISDVKKKYAAGIDEFPHKNFVNFGESLFTFVIELFAHVDHVSPENVISKLRLSLESKPKHASMTLTESAGQEAAEEADSGSSRPRSKSADLGSDENGSPPAPRLTRLQRFAEKMKITDLIPETALPTDANRSSPKPQALTDASRSSPKLSSSTDATRSPLSPNRQMSGYPS